jgi:hypothetical protein
LSRIEDLIERFFASRVSEEEHDEILELLRSGRIEGAVKDRIAQTLSESLRAREIPDLEMSTKGEEIFQLILKKNTTSTKGAFHLQRHDGRLKKFELNYRGLLPYAAVFIIMVVAGLFAYPWTTPEHKEIVKELPPACESISVFNSLNTAQKVTLKDGSTVILEPGGEVSFDKNFINGREVYLTGDAFFDVTKDPSRPFFVYTNEVTTKVLGTSFRIKANQGEKEIVVAVKTGKVTVTAKAVTNDVRTKDIQEITLTPNQQAIYKRNEQVVVKKIVEEPQVIKGHTTIKDSYVNESVVLILQALTESYGVDIRFDKESLSGCTLTSDIIEGEGLFEQLEIVCNALGGTYKMENDASIVIEANGCESGNVKP